MNLIEKQTIYLILEIKHVLENKKSLKFYKMIELIFFLFLFWFCY